jgi:hypothetical protein
MWMKKYFCKKNQPFKWMLITLIKWIVTPWFMSKKEIVYKQTLIVCYKPIIFSTHNYEKKTFCIAKIYF